MMPWRNRYFFVLDLLLIGLAVYLGFSLRLEGFDLDNGSYLPAFLTLLVASELIVPIVFQRMHLYTVYWRYASARDLLRLVAALALAVMLSNAASLCITLILGFALWPRAVPLIWGLLALPLVSAPRALRRLINQSQANYRKHNKQETVAIVGAGDAGAMIAGEILHNPQLGIQLVGFFDDAARKHHLRIYGVPVLGDRHAIPQMVQQHDIDQIIIAMPSVPGKTIRDILHICEQTGVQTRTVPGLYELLDGTVNVRQIRDVQIEDLLRREPIRINTDAVKDLVHGKRVLVTGGGGSIGAELCTQLLHFEPDELIIVGHGENSVFEIQNQLAKKAHSSTVIHSVIADIRNAKRLDHIFAKYQPHIVLHAAAHKHVPLMETNGAEAVTNNIIGTKNILAAAQSVNVERLVMISTDKAVNPTSIMGASKRVAELLVHRTACEIGKPYMAVRFGNVLGSRGSVVRTFQQQIAAGGPVTVTHPEVMRYFMTIPEAVQLVLQAAVLGEGGEIFMLDMGEPIKIVDLARDLIRLSGLEPGADIDIVFTGMRLGDKLYEELFIADEVYQSTRHEKIFIAGKSSSYTPLPNLDNTIEALAQAASCDDRKAIIDGLQSLIPEGNLSSVDNSSPQSALELPPR